VRRRHNAALYHNLGYLATADCMWYIRRHIMLKHVLANSYYYRADFHRLGVPLL